MSGKRRKKDHTPTIALCMIVRNERQNLAELLPQAASHFDEIVIVDTGSGDGTAEFARQYTEKVYEFPWTDDFSAARNFGLDRAESDWVFWLDADDRIDPNHARLLRNYTKNRDTAFFARVIAGSADDGADFLQLRLFPRLLGVNWEAPVHEQILPSLKDKGLRFEVLSGVAIRHLGYDEPAVGSEKTLRNVRLLERERAERPDDPNLLHHLGQAYGLLGKPEQAIEVLEKLVNILSDNPADEFSLHAMNLLVQHYALLDMPDRALERAQRILEIQPNDCLVKYLVGELSFRGGHFTEAIDRLKSFCASKPSPGRIAIPWKALKANAHNYLGLAFARTGRSEDAIAEFRDAIDAGARIEAYRNLASLYMEKQRFQEAAAVLSAAVQKQPSDAALWINYAVALARSNELARAAEAFQKALLLDPDNAIAKQNLSVLSRMMTSTRRFEKSFTLSTCMIVKDEAKSIRQAIESVMPISDEIVVVDTGSSDATIRIARECGARVEQVEWSDDFAAARNAALELASSEWVLVIDADESLAPSDLETIAGLSTAADIWGYSMTTRNYSADRRIIGWRPAESADPAKDMTAGQPGWFPSVKVRLFRRLPHIRFEGCVHECVEPSVLRAGKRIENLDVPIHHYGYINDREAKRRKYLELAKRKADANPADARAHCELGIQHLDMGEFADAERALEQAMRRDPRNERALLNLAVAKINLDKLDDARRLLSEAIQVNPASACARYNLAVVLEKLGRPDEAEQHYEKAASLDPSDAHAVAKLGYLRAHRGDFAAAREQLERALVLDPNHKAARNNLEYVLKKDEAAAAPSRCDLSLNMIVKDEEQNLNELLGPIAHLFDEIVVVDTGSSDATAEVARQLGAKVIHHPWNNNFSDARNTALRHSSGKWIFWLDADDRIEPRAVRTLRKFIDRGIPCGVFFPLESRIGRSGALVQNYMLRLFPNHPQARWHGAVHEQIAPSLKVAGLELFNCPDFTIRHIGYESDEEVLRKNLRNLKLLSSELAARPEDPYVLFALAQAFLLCGQVKNAAGWLKNLWRLRVKVDAAAWREVFWMAAVVLSDCAAASGNHSEAEAWLTNAIEIAPDNWLAYFLLGERKLLSGDADSARPLLERAAEAGVAPTILPLNVAEFEEKLRQYLMRLNQSSAEALPASSR